MYTAGAGLLLDLLHLWVLKFSLIFFFFLNESDYPGLDSGRDSVAGWTPEARRGLAALSSMFRHSCGEILFVPNTEFRWGVKYNFVYQKICLLAFSLYSCHLLIFVLCARKRNFMVEILWSLLWEKDYFLCFPWKFKFINTLITVTPVSLKCISFGKKMPSCLFSACYLWSHNRFSRTHYTCANVAVEPVIKLVLWKLHHNANINAVRTVYLMYLFIVLTINCAL